MLDGDMRHGAWKTGMLRMPLGAEGRESNDDAEDMIQGCMVLLPSVNSKNCFILGTVYTSDTNLVGR